MLVLTLMIVSCGGSDDSSNATIQPGTDPFATAISKQAVDTNREVIDPRTFQSNSSTFQSGEDPFKKFLEKNNQNN